MAVIESQLVQVPADGQAIWEGCTWANLLRRLDEMKGRLIALKMQAVMGQLRTIEAGTGGAKVVEEEESSRR